MASCSLGWSPAITAEMLAMFFEHKPITVIRRHLRLSYETVYQKLTRLGLVGKFEGPMGVIRGSMPAWVKYENFTREDSDRWKAA